MNLQEQISRIQEIMDKDVLNRKREVFQNLVNNSIENLKNTCETMNDEENDEEHVFFDACDFIDSSVVREIVTPLPAANPSDLITSGCFDFKI